MQIYAPEVFAYAKKLRATCWRINAGAENASKHRIKLFSREICLLFLLLF